MLIAGPPAPNLALVVVIPTFAETDTITCLESLRACRLPADCSVEVLVVINHAISAPPEIARINEETRSEIDSFLQKIPESRLKIHCLFLPDLPDKKAGVGMARKIGMDEAVRRFASIGKEGHIVNLDADCTVAENYFEAIISGFERSPQAWAAGLHFEHPLTESSALTPELRAVVDYELHLRYFIGIQRSVGLPFAFQTVGSSMVVRSEAYQKMGGMNCRQAGEDFYFLHKFISVGRFIEINDTTVYPSARPSFRVPFGTGRAVSSVLEGTAQQTYDEQSFDCLVPMVLGLRDLSRRHITSVDWLKGIPEPLRSYLRTVDVPLKLEEIRRETSTEGTFCNRFFQWFNAFRLMKYLHFAREMFPDRAVFSQALKFARSIDSELASVLTPVELLEWYRRRDRGWQGR